MFELLCACGCVYVNPYARARNASAPCSHTGDTRVTLQLVATRAMGFPVLCSDSPQLAVSSGPNMRRGQRFTVAKS